MKKVNQMFFLKPWAILPDALRPMAQIVDRYMKGDKLSLSEIETIASKPSKKEKDAVTYEVRDGVAYIPVYGIIAKHMSLIQRISGPSGTSVLRIEEDFMTALDDEAVEAIVLDIDSPGGSVDGVAELAELIYASRGQKPIYAFANSQMASAAYWIGSAADQIYASISADVGSIGVYSVLEDYSVMDHNAGIKTDIVKAGRYKAAGHPSKPLTDDERATIQELVNSYYELFVDAVARNRGVSRDQALEWADGRVFIGQKSVDIGLVDGIKTIKTIANGHAGKPAAGSDQVYINQENNEEGKNMDIKTMTKETFERDRPDLVEAFRTQFSQPAQPQPPAPVPASPPAPAALEKATTDERSRVTKITGLLKAPEFSGYRDIAFEAIEKGHTFEAAEGRMKDQRIKDLEAGAPKSPGPSDGDDNSTFSDMPPGPDKWKAEYAKSADLQKEFMLEADYLAFKKAEQAKSFSIKG